MHLNNNLRTLHMLDYHRAEVVVEAAAVVEEDMTFKTMLHPRAKRDPIHVLIKHHTKKIKTGLIQK